MPFVHQEAAEELARQVALDELSRLVAALAKRDLIASQIAFHALCMPVAEQKFAFTVHQIDEVVKVVFQHARKDGFTKKGNQLVRGASSDSRDLLKGIHDQVALRLGRCFTSGQTPQRATAVAAGLAFCAEIAVCRMVFQQTVFLAVNHRSARCTGCQPHVLRLATSSDRNDTLHERRLPIEAHTHAHTS